MLRRLVCTRFYSFALLCCTLTVSVAMACSATQLAAAHDASASARQRCQQRCEEQRAALVACLLLPNAIVFPQPRALRRRVVKPSRNTPSCQVLSFLKTRQVLLRVERAVSRVLKLSCFSLRYVRAERRDCHLRPHARFERLKGRVFLVFLFSEST